MKQNTNRIDTATVFAKTYPFVRGCDRTNCCRPSNSERMRGMVNHILHVRPTFHVESMIECRIDRLLGRLDTLTAEIRTLIVEYHVFT